MSLEFMCVGLVRTDMGDTGMIVSADVGEEGASCYYNDDPYGIIGCHGFDGLRFKPVPIPVKDHVPAAYGELAAILDSDIHGEVNAVISCEEGLVLIRNTTYFTGYFLKKGSMEAVPLESNFIELSDGEDTLSEEDMDEIASM